MTDTTTPTDQPSEIVALREQLNEYERQIGDNGSQMAWELLSLNRAALLKIESLGKERDESKRKLAITDGVIRGLLNDQRLGLNMRDFLEQTLKRIE